MRTLTDVSCTDKYDGSPAAIQWVYGCSGGFFQVTGHDALCQIASGGLGSETWTDEFLAPVGNATIAPGTIGIRFRNAVAGSVAVVTAAMSERVEPPVSITAGGISTGGGAGGMNFLAFWGGLVPALTGTGLEWSVPYKADGTAYAFTLGRAFLRLAATYTGSTVFAIQRSAGGNTPFAPVAVATLTVAAGNYESGLVACSTAIVSGDVLRLIYSTVAPAVLGKPAVFNAWVAGVK